MDEQKRIEKARAPNNRTLTLTDSQRNIYSKQLVKASDITDLNSILNKTINADLYDVLDRLPCGFADLLIIDPPYNLSKDFGTIKFNKTDDKSYIEYLESWLPAILKVLKPSGSVYLCGDWKNSICLYSVLQKYSVIRNRITWQREKGRGAKNNWKNSTEDIWYATLSDDFYFDIESVKQKRIVLAPYTSNGKPKDWEKTTDGNFRLTYPSNFWDDISIPFWSMPENTDHPTQKPEKLIAKLILASCPKDGIVFDPFLGSGTTSVTAKKLGRNFCGIEMNTEYCLWTQKRLEAAETDKEIQGYSDNVFWERNTLKYIKK